MALKSIKKGKSAAFAVMVCVGMAAVVPQVVTYAGGHLETDRSCSLSVVIESEWTELTRGEILVDLYHVADVSADGVYTADSDYSELALSGVDSTTTAQQWQEYAQSAQKLVTDGKEADASITLKNGTGSIGNLATGLYLVSAQEYVSENFGYSFPPYLVSLPNSDYSSDEWVYDNVVVSLKPQQYERKSGLEIVKTIRGYHTGSGSVMCVFDVEAVRDGKSVYSDVVSLSFSEPGQKSIVIDDIPVGADVTVTEVYSGAGYQVVTEPVQTAKIVADANVRVLFTNDYVNTLTYGTGVVNHFEGDGSGHFTWQQLDENKQEGQHEAALQ